MSNSTINTQPPQRLLLATDFDARTDRALERAKQLATQWRAKLTIVTVREGPREPNEVLRWIDSDGKDYGDDVVRHAVAKEFSGSNVPVSLHIANGEIAPAIQEVATQFDIELVVVGMARCETLGRFLLGSTTERLSHLLKQSLLVVRSRVSGSYQRIVIASDFSPNSLNTVKTAMRLFPRCDLHVFHAHAAMSPLPPTDPSVADNMTDSVVQVEGLRFLDTCNLDSENHSRLKLVIKEGPLEVELGNYVRSNDVDLVVAGLKERSGLMDVLVGRPTDRLLHWLSCDTLIVPYRDQKGGA